MNKIGYFDDVKTEYSIENMYPPLRPLKNYLWNEGMLLELDQFGNGPSKACIGATYEKVSYAEPQKVNDINATFDETTSKLTLTWTGVVAWHYNIYSVGETETQAYKNMLGEAFENTFTYQLSHKGTYWLVIEPESDQGILGKPVKIKVEVK